MDQFLENAISLSDVKKKVAPIKSEQKSQDKV